MRFTSLLYLSLLLLTSFALSDDETYAQGVRERLADLQRNPTLEAIHEFTFQINAIRRDGRNNREKQDLAREISLGLIAIPGHARLFADELERLRSEVVARGTPRGNQSTYDRLRNYYLGGLRFLPSPESIEVLGRYLHDERDIPIDISFLPSNAYIASQTLVAIGLRDAPISGRVVMWDPEALETHRAWYKEVKSGERPFSFVGQQVEFRFRPDGTVESREISVVDPPVVEPAVAKVPDAPLPAPVEPPAASRFTPVAWPWVAAALLAILALGWRMMARPNP